MDAETEDIFAALEEEDVADDYRAQRLEQLQSEFSSKQQQQDQEPHRVDQDGQLQSNTLPNNNAQSSSTAQHQTVSSLLNHSSPVSTISSDQILLDFTTQIPQCIVHFFHPDFSRCATMDKHLAALASAHHDTGPRFARTDVRDVPFVVEKLKIRVLPCVLAFHDGVVVERVVGFEGLGMGGSDAEKEFETKLLEERFVSCGVLEGKKVGSGVGAGDGDESEDEEDDEEDDEDAYPRRRKAIRSGGRRTMGGDDDDDWD